MDAGRNTRLHGQSTRTPELDNGLCPSEATASRSGRARGAEPPGRIPVGVGERDGDYLSCETAALGEQPLGGGRLA